MPIVDLGTPKEWKKIKCPHCGARFKSSHVCRKLCGQPIITRRYAIEIAERNKMKLKQKPAEPKGKKYIERSVRLCDGDSVASALSQIPDGVGLDKVYFGREWEYGDYSSFYFRWKQDETDEEFNRRMKSYEESLARYNEWYDANKEEIDKELLARSEKAKKKRSDQAENIRKKIARLEKEIKKLERE